MQKQWLVSPPPPDVETTSRRWGVPSLVAQILLNRGLKSDDPAEPFLSPQLKDLYPPECLPNTDAAAALIAEVLTSREPIVLYGDYDVDGTTGVAILWRILRQAGADVGFYVPHRTEEGYGLNPSAVKRILEDGAKLIISVDCGITAVEVAREVRAAGKRLIVTDHHAPQSTLPDADFLVHPGLDGTYPNPHLCGAGVAFKLAWAIARRLSGSERVAPPFRDLLLDLLPFVALGTIADVVPLTGENRVLAKHGLERLVQTRHPGLQALMQSAGLTSGRITGYDVGFRLAPRINAAGRMGHARLAVELFTRADPARANEIALYLEDQNRSRQATERHITRQAVDMIERGKLASDARRAIVLASHEWHPGVIGIVAARLVERFHRPTIMIALNEGDGLGSARSVSSFHLADALSACQEHLVSYGGHGMAAGLRIRADRILPFTDSFVGVANQRLTAMDLVPNLRLDAEVPLEALTLSATETILRLGPFGMGNPKPRLATGWVDVAQEPRCVGKNQEHLQVSFRENGTSIKGIGFGLSSCVEDLKQHRRCRVAFEPILNEYQGRRSVEMQILDFQFPGRP